MFHLEQFLDRNSIIEEASLEVLYVQKPQKSLDELIAKGVIRIGDAQYTLKTTMNEHGNIEIESEPFWFYVKLDEAIKFLEEVGD
ncbi:hypothetical protein GFB69_12195 [Acidianus ambivalens]|uniref:Uncharacterized protein n=1 Tax=Acidianus ambivalens TaxID=2283 RepID=A0A6G1T640_ACIAM|nr:hypothetical protein [Acidianus ambivalens]